MNLTDYYEQLPRAIAPKTEFVKKIASLCNVDLFTVRLWVQGKTKPRNQRHIEILEEETGIKSTELFKK